MQKRDNKTTFVQTCILRYTERVPSGMLPAVEIDGEVITESDQVLYALEQVPCSICI